MSKRCIVSIGLFVFLFLVSMPVRAEIFFAYLEPQQEVPPSLSSIARGYARINVNEPSLTISYVVVFNNLSSNQISSHIHAPAAIGVNGPVIISLGVVGGTSGTIFGTGIITLVQLDQLRAHRGYVNVHSAAFPGGEIRGQLGPKRPVDFDGDGRQDLSVLRSSPVVPPAVSQITFYNNNSTAGISAFAFGDANTDIPVPGDYDGDGLDDFAVYRTGQTMGADGYFLIQRSSDNAFQFIRYGVTGDIPVARDYDADGITDPAVFRVGAAAGAQAVWFIRQSSTGGTTRTVPFGTTGTSPAGDTPVPGDYDGDGKFDVAVYRHGIAPANTFIVLRSFDGQVVYQPYGNFLTDYIVPGDYDGDGKFDFCVARVGPTLADPMVWYFRRSSDGQERGFQYGLTADVPVQGDYDGDATTDVAVYRRGETPDAQSVFFAFGSFNNASVATPWGLRLDNPLAAFDAH